MTRLSLTLLALTTVTTVTTATTVLTNATNVSEATPDTSPGATNVSEVTLDMCPGAFDDRYRGCSGAMAAALPALNRSELRGDFGRAWTLATAEWGVRRGPASPLSPLQAIALLSYTAPLPLHRAFNAAVRRAGRSPRQYRDNFHFKTLHFLLTTALAALRDAEVTERGQRCHRVFRGLRGLRARARRGDDVRFGHFASASKRNESARAFGTDTIFEILTCHGAEIREFSFFPLEDEVLVPPFETFRVTDVTWAGDTARVALSSSGTFSAYNCLWVTGQRCGDGPCELDSGWSVPRSPPHLGGLLVATTALAVATGTF
ncbi:erythroblast NAD(P)(+)--arginine ADP-ribosyltransferase-like isoform X2 [Chamaea fasciata]|uniref:erythroblast NAD(P)(+)--arginine ADP-ribosyltransferase-like isoform X2 n=1 Tax=Chamaea fasciata TaxID=190680 RepID=UPI003369C98F